LPARLRGRRFLEASGNFFAYGEKHKRQSYQQVALTSEMLLAPQDLRRPYNAEWSFTKSIPPGEEQTLEKPGTRSASAQAVLGWVFLPNAIKYEDGSSWYAQSESECFHVIWRDPQHPDMPALPPRKMEINPD
jgi:hypothetical protein